MLTASLMGLPNPGGFITVCITSFLCKRLASIVLYGPFGHQKLITNINPHTKQAK